MYSCLVFFKIMSLLQTYSRLKIKLFPIHWIYSVKFDKIFVVTLVQSRHIAILWQNHNTHSPTWVLRIDMYIGTIVMLKLLSPILYIHLWNWTDGSGLNETKLYWQHFTWCCLNDHKDSIAMVIPVFSMNFFPVCHEGVL